MAILTFNGNSYTVDHAVKGTDYVYGYDANGVCIVALDGVTDFSGVSYDGVYMSPETCATDPHNNVVYCNGVLSTPDGRNITSRATSTLPASGWSGSAPYTQTISVEGVLATDDPFVDVYLEGVSDGTAILEAWMLVGRLSTADGSITAYCYEEVPTVDIPIILKVVR